MRGRCDTSVTSFVHFTNTQRRRYVPLRRPRQRKCCILANNFYAFEKIQAGLSYQELGGGVCSYETEGHERSTRTEIRKTRGQVKHFLPTIKSSASSISYILLKGTAKVIVWVVSMRSWGDIQIKQLQPKSHDIHTLSAFQISLFPST